MPNYIGRFAPSPSGPLHFGSLVAAIGSYLHARINQGLWRVRIEDIDPPREVPGATQWILQSLEQHGLYWDGEVVYQSQRHKRYDEVLADLNTQQKTYYCQCTRKRIKAIGGTYDGHCRDKDVGVNGSAIRLVNQQRVDRFEDGLLGQIHTSTDFAKEDFILKRRDGLYAYQLAVVIDDHDQGITDIVRGNDLLETTVRQLTLFKQLGWPTPRYLHLPLAVWSDGHKLSKQNHAPALDDKRPSSNLVKALSFLGQRVEQEWIESTPEQILTEAIARFDVALIPTTRSIPV